MNVTDIEYLPVYHGLSNKRWLYHEVWKKQLKLVKLLGFFLHNSWHSQRLLDNPWLIFYIYIENGNCSIQKIVFMLCKCNVLLRWKKEKKSANDI